MLIDYRCPSCTGVTEHWVNRPVPEQVSCPACGDLARRVFGLGGMGSSARTAALAPPPSDPGFCLRNSGVPAICHLHPSAARRWAAVARGDEKAVKREIAFQEAGVAAGTIDPKQAITH